MTAGGRGRSVVLLHGFTGGPGSWDGVRAHLDPERPVFAPAVLGHDGTPGSDHVHAFTDELDRLAAMVRAWIADDASARQDPRLVGYSLGGRLALGLLLRHPGLFGSGVLIGSSAGLTDEVERRARRERDEGGRGCWKRKACLPSSPPGSACRSSAHRSGCRRPRWASRAEYAAPTTPGLARSLRVLGLGAMPDFRPLLATMGRPIRLVVGAADDRFHGLATEMAGRIPGAQVCIIAGAGHNVVLERPADVARIIEELDP